MSACGTIPIMNGSIQTFHPDGGSEYTFPRLLGAESAPAPVQEQYTNTRPGVLVIPGAGGGYDLRGEDDDPLSPFETRYSFMLIANDLAALHAAYDQLMTACYDRKGRLFIRHWDAAAPGVTGSTAQPSKRRFLRCKCRTVEGPAEPKSIYGGHLPRWPLTLTFFATDPTWYEDYGNGYSPARLGEGYTLSGRLQAYSGLGVVYDLDSADSSPLDISVYNRGSKVAQNFRARIVVDSGQLRNPTIIRYEGATVVERLQITTVVTAGSTVTIDNGTRQVGRSADNDLYGSVSLLDTQVDLFTLQRGWNRVDLEFGSTAFTGSFEWQLRTPYV